VRLISLLTAVNQLVIVSAQTTGELCLPLLVAAAATANK